MHPFPLRAGGQNFKRKSLVCANMKVSFFDPVIPSVQFAESKSNLSVVTKWLADDIRCWGLQVCDWAISRRSSVCCNLPSLLAAPIRRERQQHGRGWPVAQSVARVITGGSSSCNHSACWTWLEDHAVNSKSHKHFKSLILKRIVKALR